MAKRTKGNIRYEYFTIDVPSDMYEDPEKRADYAIYAAREQASTYRVPCNWRIVWDNGEQVKVCRESRR